VCEALPYVLTCTLYVVDDVVLGLSINENGDTTYSLSPEYVAWLPSSS